MPIPKDDPKLIQQVIDDAIRQPEISAQLDGIGRRRRAALLQRLAAQPEALWNAAAREIQQGEALEAKLRDDWRQLEASLPAEPRGLALLRWPYGA